MIIYKRTIKIGLISDSVRTQSTGIGYYTRSVINEIRVDKKSKKYVLIDFIKTNFNEKYILLVKNPFPFLKTYLWHNCLPFKLKKTDMDYIFNFTAVPHVFPFKQKEIFFVYDISWYLYPEYHKKMRVLYYRLFFKICLKKCFKIVTDSTSAKNDLIKYFKIPENKIYVIYPPFIDNTKELNKIKQNITYPYLLFIGTLEPRKNIISIIKTFKIVKDTYGKKHKLIICGKKGWQFDEIFNLIKELDLESDVIYLGYITDEEKKWLYKNAEVFIYPSWYEGFGIPVLEAMTYGCPVITSNISSLPEAAGTAGIAINPGNVDELVKAISKVLSSKNLQKKMREDGFQQVKKLSNKNQIQELLKTLK